MRFNQNLRAAALGVLIVSVAMPVLAAGKHFAKAERIEMRKAIANGIVLTGPASATCNGGHAVPIPQCMRKT